MTAAGMETRPKKTRIRHTTPPGPARGPGTKIAPCEPASATAELLRVIARLRAPDGCPWDRKQTHKSLRRHAVEEVYELIDAIEAGDDESMADELGDLLLQVVLHCQLAKERAAFDFDRVCGLLVEKLIRRHPHVFGSATARTAAAVWAQWDHIKHAEKAGTRHARTSALEGIPRHLPALMKAEKLVKKARKAGLASSPKSSRRLPTKAALGRQLFELAAQAQAQGWSAEELLRKEIQHRHRHWLSREKKRRPAACPSG